MTVESGLQFLSKLKWIKTYLRSTITQVKSTDLTILSIENKITNNIVLEDVEDEDFTSDKSRKIRF